MSDDQTRKPETAAAERPPHPTVPIQIWVDVDEGIVNFVRHLNTLPGVRTWASCQGGLTYGPQVMVTWQDDAAFARLKRFPMTMISETLAYVHPLQGAAHPLARDCAMTHANDDRHAAIPVPRGGFATDEEEARWMEQTILMRTKEGLRSIGLNVEPKDNGLYDLFLLCLKSAGNRAVRKESHRGR